MAEPITKSEITELNQLTAEVRKISEKVQKDALDLEQIAKMNERLDKLDESCQKLMLDDQREAKAQDEVLLKLNKLEESLSSEKLNSKTNERSQAMKDFLAYAQGGVENKEIEAKSMAQQETKATARTDFGPYAGYLVPTEFNANVIEEILEISPIRPICNVITMNSNSLEWPKLVGQPEAFYKGELEEAEETQAEFELLELTNDALTACIVASRDQIMNSAINFEAFMQRRLGISFSFKENKRFLDGDGANKPQGMLTSAEPNQFTTAVSGTLSFDDIIDLEATIKQGYTNLRYVFNRSTLAYLKKLTDNEGQYLWQPRLDLSSPATLNGYPYVIAQDMPNVQANAKAVMFGDFNSGYTITDRMGMTMVIDPYTQAKKRSVVYTFAMWNGGQVVNGEAFTVATIAP